MGVTYNSHPYGLLTYTSPSNKRTLKADGLYTFGAHNLYLNSAAPADQSVTVVSGATYSVTITGATSVTASGAAAGTWTAGTTTFTAATGTLTLASTSGAGTVHIRRTPSDSLYLETTAAARYALPFEWNTSAALQGILTEPAATNLLTNTSIFDNASWTKINLTLTADAAASPDGTTTADLIVADATNSNHAFNRAANYTVTASTAYVLSVFVKAAGLTKGRLVLPNNGYTIVAVLDFDLSDGSSSASVSVGAATNVAGGVIAYPNGWYRVYVTAILSTSVLANAQLSLRDAAGSLSFVGDGVSGMYVWGAQSELGVYPTSYVDGVAATGTRAADNPSLATTSFPYSLTALTLFVQAKVLDADRAGVGQRIVSLQDASLTANSAAVLLNTVGTLTPTTFSGSVQQALLSAGTVTDGAVIKAAMSAQLNQVAAETNFTDPADDVAATMPTSLTTLYFGRDQTASNMFHGYIQKVAVFPRFLSEAEREALVA